MTKAYYVTRHLKIGNVKGEMYNSEVKAFAQFAELDGKSQAVAVWDEQLTELKYYGSPEETNEEMKEEVKEEMKEEVLRMIRPVVSEIKSVGRSDRPGPYLSCEKSEGKVGIYHENNGSGRQEWQLEKASDDTEFGHLYHIMNVGGSNSGSKFLSTNRSGRVGLYYKDNESGRQLWEVSYVDKDLYGDFYNITVSGGTNKGEKFLSSNAPGWNPTWDVFLHHEDNGSGRQRWRITNSDILELSKHDPNKPKIDITSIDWQYIRSHPAGSTTSEQIMVGVTETDSEKTTTSKTFSASFTVSASYTAFGATAAASATTSNSASKIVERMSSTTLSYQKTTTKTWEKSDKDLVIWGLTMYGVLLAHSLHVAFSTPLTHPSCPLANWQVKTATRKNSSTSTKISLRLVPRSLTR